MKTHMWCTTSTRMKLFAMWAPLCHRPTSKVKPGGDVPNLDGYRDQNDWGELTEPDLEPEKLPDDSELLLFFND